MGYKVSCGITAFYNSLLNKESINKFLENMHINNIYLYGEWYENQNKKFEKNRDIIIEKILDPKFSLPNVMLIIYGLISTEKVNKYISMSFYFEKDEAELMSITMFSDNTLNAWKITSPNDLDMPDIDRYVEVMKKLSDGLDLIKLETELIEDY